MFIHVMLYAYMAFTCIYMAFTSHRLPAILSVIYGSTFCIVEVLSSCRKAGDSDSNSLHSKEDSGMASGPLGERSPKEFRLPSGYD